AAIVAAAGGRVAQDVVVPTDIDEQGVAVERVAVEGRDGLPVAQREIDGSAVPVGQMSARIGGRAEVEKVVVAVEAGLAIEINEEIVAGEDVEDVVAHEDVLRTLVHADGVADDLVNGIVDNLRRAAVMDQNALVGVGVNQVVRDRTGKGKP